MMLDGAQVLLENGELGKEDVGEGQAGNWLVLVLSQSSNFACAAALPWAKSS